MCLRGGIDVGVQNIEQVFFGWIEQAEVCALGAAPMISIRRKGANYVPANVSS
jgi:hypothetical protein